MEGTSERRRASIVEALQPKDEGPLTLDRIWAAAALVLDNIYVELNKRLEQLQESLEAKVIGAASPTGETMVAYNKARVQFQADCARVLSKFHNEFEQAKRKYEKELAKSGGREASTAALKKLFDRFTRKVNGLQDGMAELVAKGNSVLDTPQLSITLLRYWAEHDRVMRQVYNSLIDLDSSTRSCTMDMSSEMQHITAFAEMLRQESADCFNAQGQFDLGGGYGLPEQQLRVDEPEFPQPPQPKKVPASMLSFAEESLASAGASVREHGSDAQEDGRDAPQWSGGVSNRVLEGTLQKKSPAAGKSWQSRWCVLHGSSPARLSYFKRRTDDEPVGYINLELLAACFTTTELKHAGKGIKLMMLDQRTYYLKASTPRDAQTWVSAISEAAARSSAVADGGADDDDVGGAEVDSDGEPGSDDEDEDSSEEEEDDSLVPMDDAVGGISEEELRALQAEEASLLAENERLKQEVAQLESEIDGLF